jgi:hypothetical protein
MAKVIAPAVVHKRHACRPSERPVGVIRRAAAGA